MFPSPVDTTGEAQCEYYRQAPSGWSKCPLGYAVYATDVGPEGMWRLVVYGLKVKGISRVRGKSPLLNIMLNRENVEGCINEYFVAIRISENFFQSMISTGVHEIRNINKDLYNAIYELKENLERSGASRSGDVDLARNVEALSELLKVRSDLFDCFSNPDLLHAARSRVPVYKAFDRIRKCLLPSARVKNVEMKMNGISHSFVDAIQHFDVIPYTLLQNAIKYSPNTHDGLVIEVDIREMSGKILVHVMSFGPMVDTEEVEMIFLSGFRGNRAREFEARGSGIGLYFAKRLVEMHDEANVRFTQEKAGRTFAEGMFYRTHVNLEFRIDGEEEAV